MKKCNIINNRREAIYYEEDDNYNRFNYIIKNIDIIKISLPTYIVNTYFIFFILFFTFISKKRPGYMYRIKSLLYNRYFTFLRLL